MAFVPLAPTPFGAFYGSTSLEDPSLALGEPLANHHAMIQVSHRILPDSVTLLLLVVFAFCGFFAAQVDIEDFAKEEDEKAKTKATNIGETQSETQCTTSHCDSQDGASLWRLHLLALVLAVVAKLWTPSLRHSLEDPWLGMRGSMVPEVHGMALQELSALTGVVADPWIWMRSLTIPLLWLLGLIGVAAARVDIMDFIAAEEAKEAEAKDTAAPPSTGNDTAQTDAKEDEQQKEGKSIDKFWKKQPLDDYASRLYSVLLVLVVLTSPLLIVLADLGLSRSAFDGLPWIGPLDSS